MDENLTRRCSVCIENTVKERIPGQPIRQTDMSQETRDISLDGDVQDSADPEVLDEGDDPTAFTEEDPAEVQGETQGEIPGEVPMQPEHQLKGLEHEFKTGTSVQTAPIEDHEHEEYGEGPGPEQPAEYQQPPTT